MDNYAIHETWSISAAICAACAAVAFAVAQVSVCTVNKDNAKTDRTRSDNDAVVKLVAAGATPMAARCAVSGDRTSAACVMAAAKPEVAVVSSIRADELKPSLTEFEQQLLGKK